MGRRALATACGVRSPRTHSLQHHGRVQHQFGHGSRLWVWAPLSCGGCCFEVVFGFGLGLLVCFWVWGLVWLFCVLVQVPVSFSHSSWTSPVQFRLQLIYSSGWFLLWVQVQLTDSFSSWLSWFQFMCFGCPFHSMLSLCSSPPSPCGFSTSPAAAGCLAS